jgi:hypothetical protein
MFARRFAFILCCLLSTLLLCAQPRTTPARKTFQHPQNFTVQYPADWRVETTSEFAQILPPGATAQDQTINIRLLTLPAPITVTDPRFSAEMDQLAAQLPGFSKVGATQSYLTKSGSGLRGVWAGMNPTIRQQVQLRMYATTLNGLAIVVFAVGQASKLEPHETALRDLAASIAPSTAAANTAKPAVPTAPTASDRSPLAQQWLQRLRGKKLVQMSSYNSGGGSGGYSSKTEIHLNADSTFQARSESSVSVYVPGANGGSSGAQKAEGVWRIYVKDNQAVLEMKYSNGQIETNILQANGEQTFINGKRWFVVEQ